MPLNDDGFPILKLGEAVDRVIALDLALVELAAYFELQMADVATGNVVDNWTVIGLAIDQHLRVTLFRHSGRLYVGLLVSGVTHGLPTAGDCISVAPAVIMWMGALGEFWAWSSNGLFDVAPAHCIWL